MEVAQRTAITCTSAWHLNKINNLSVSVLVFRVNRQFNTPKCDLQPFFCCVSESQSVELTCKQPEDRCLQARNGIQPKKILCADIRYANICKSKLSPKHLLGSTLLDLKSNYITGKDQLNHDLKAILV